ncbi:hypothetical protein TIFTF001_008991 [Ficus carica]|uniref:FLZ-type domain-containing protein n=1 Tax=Ficus carica TaxID=3494 RepID=A0AA87ZVU1_FICCA|nr:hypothetical protein TIFTF001_008991 [Ficus carica]
MGHQPISDSGSESFFPHSSDVLNDNPKSYKNNSFYSVPGLLVGLSPNGLTSTTDCDSVRSPTSPLDFKLFSSLGNPFKSSSTTTTTTTTTRATQENGQQRIWGVSSKVGLISIIDSLDDDMKFPGKVLRSSESKNILFGPSFRIKTCSGGQANTNSFESPKSLPKNYTIFPPASKTKSPFGKGSSDVLFEIGESPLEPTSFGEIRSCSLDSCREISNVSGHLNNSNYNPNSTSMNFCLESKVVTQVSSPPPKFIEGSPNSNQISGSKLSAIPGSVGSGNGFIGSLSASEIELSEDYTCVISHGPNPKTTHIFGDCILETESCDLSNSFGKNGDNKEIGLSPPIVENPEISAPFSSDYFLSFCYSCNRKLEDGKDIYIYRGEKAFCSLSCRSLEILIDEKLEKSNDKDPESPLYPNDDDNDDKELFEAGLKAAT